MLSEKDQGLVEYAIMIAILAIIVIVVLFNFRPETVKVIIPVQKD